MAWLPGGDGKRQLTVRAPGTGTVQVYDPVRQAEEIRRRVQDEITPLGGAVTVFCFGFDGS